MNTTDFLEPEAHPSVTTDVVRMQGTFFDWLPEVEIKKRKRRIYSLRIKPKKPLVPVEELPLLALATAPAPSVTICPPFDPHVVKHRPKKTEVQLPDDSQPLVKIRHKEDKPKEEKSKRKKRSHDLNNPFVRSIKAAYLARRRDSIHNVPNTLFEQLEDISNDAYAAMWYEDNFHAKRYDY